MASFFSVGQKYGNDAVFYRSVQTSAQNITDELHIILKRRNLEICKHSISVQLLNKNMFNH